MPPAYLSPQQFLQLQAALLGRTNIRPRSITEDKLAVGAASAAVVRDGSISDVHIDELTVGALTGGTIAGESITLSAGGTIQSDGFVSGSTGWQIAADGSAEFNSGTFRGNLEAGTIDIGGADATSFHVDASGNMWLGAAAFASAPFRVSSAGAVTASSATITGALTTSAGSAIGAQYLGSGSTTADLTIDTGGWVRSQNYSAGTAGWAIDASGTAEFNDATVRGDLVSGTISIGGTNAFNVDSSGNIWNGPASSYSAAREFRVAAAGTVGTHTYTVYNEVNGDTEARISYNEGVDRLEITALQNSSAVLYLESENASISVNPGTDLYFNMTTGGDILVASGGTWDGFMQLRSTENQPFRLVDSSTSTTASVNSNIRFGGSDGNEDGRVGLAQGDMQLRNANNFNVEIWTNDTLSWQWNGDGDFSAQRAGMDFTAGDTSTHMGVFSWWSSTTGTPMEFNNDIDMGSNSPQLLDMTIGSDNDTPGNNDHYIRFRKNVNTPVVVGSIDGGGSNNVRYNLTSDRRLKKKIRPSEALEHFDMIPWRTYEQLWRAPASKETRKVTRHGVIAQDIYFDEDLRPLKMYVSKGDPDGVKKPEQYWGFDYPGLIGMIGAALAETRRELGLTKGT